MNTFYRVLLEARKIKKKENLFSMLLSIAIGIAAGGVAIIMKNSVHWISENIQKLEGHISYLHYIFPFIGLVLVFIFVKIILRKHNGHGIPGILYAISRKNARLQESKLYSSFVASIFTVGLGGSVGLEGPSASTGAAIGSNIAKRLNLSYKQSVIMIGCGATAAIAAIFNTPIAGIIFSLEVLMLNLSVTSLIPLLLSSVTAVTISYFFLGQETIWFVDFNNPFKAVDFYQYIILGVFTGFISLLFSEGYSLIEDFFQKFDNRLLRLFIGGTLLCFLIFLFPALYGEGYDIVNQCLHSNASFLFANPMFNFIGQNQFFMIIGLFLLIVLKIVATNVTFGAGGVGGIFAPSLFIGAISGFLFASILKYIGFQQVNAPLFAMVAMAGVMAGVLHGPLTSIFLIAEVTQGYILIVPLIITSVFSYLIVRVFKSNSIYTMQLAKRNELLTHDKHKSVMSLMKIERFIETDFFTLKENYMLKDIIKGVRKSKRNVFPVVNQEGNLMGIITLNDIRDYMFNTELWEKVSVHEIMYWPEVLVNLNDPVEKMAELINSTDHYNVPVLSGKKYIGFISRANLFSLYQKMSKDIL
jgi:chloride channel protein, CIC family